MKVWCRLWTVDCNLNGKWLYSSFSKNINRYIRYQTCKILRLGVPFLHLCNFVVKFALSLKLIHNYRHDFFLFFQHWWKLKIFKLHFFIACGYFFFPLPDPWILYRVCRSNCRHYILSHRHCTGKNEVSLEPQILHEDFDISHAHIGQSELKILKKLKK